MKDFVNKLNLYEILSMLIPGSAILFAIACNKDDISNLQFMKSCSTLHLDDAVVFTTIFFVLAYLTGLLHHSLMNWFWQGLKNNPTMLYYSLRKVENKGQYKYLEEVVGSAYKTEASSKSDFYDCPLFAFIVQGLSVIWHSVKGWFGLYRQEEDTTHSYYKAYYYVFEKKWGGAVSALEGQVTFIRNMLFPLVGLLCVLKEPCCCKILIGGIILFALFLLMIERQNKIYQSVFENYEYLRQIENINKKQ